jgi:hypothetical protein
MKWKKRRIESKIREREISPDEFITCCNSSQPSFGFKYQIPVPAILLTSAALYCPVWKKFIIPIFCHVCSTLEHKSDVGTGAKDPHSIKEPFVSI